MSVVDFFFSCFYFRFSIFCFTTKFSLFFFFLNVVALQQRDSDGPLSSLFFQFFFADVCFEEENVWKKQKRNEIPRRQRRSGSIFDQSNNDFSNRFGKSWVNDSFFFAKQQITGDCSSCCANCCHRKRIRPNFFFGRKTSRSLTPAESKRTVSIGRPLRLAFETPPPAPLGVALL